MNIYTKLTVVALLAVVVCQTTGSQKYIQEEKSMGGTPLIFPVTRTDFTCKQEARGPFLVTIKCASGENCLPCYSRKHDGMTSIYPENLLVDHKDFSTGLILS